MAARGLQKFLPDLAAALARFPVAALASILLCLALNVQIWLDESQVRAELIAAGAAGFLAAGVTHLFSEGRHWPRGISTIMALAAALGVATVSYFTSLFSTSQWFLLPALIVTAMIAGYLRSNVEQGAIWLFNLRLCLAALLAGIVAGLFAAGLSAIVEALNFLFNAGLTSDWHSHIWATAFSLVAPLYGLSLMPPDLDEEVQMADQGNALIKRGVSVLVNYVLVPIASVYALILHAYAVKIALQGELPKGQIGTMVTIFALGGTGAWLIAWPWRDAGTKLLRAFMRGWFWLTIIPAVLLVIAISRRIADYGVTPDRYGLVLTALWLAAVSAYLAARRNQADMRIILGGIAILLLIGAAGPWGAYGLTSSSQFARLTALMQANGLLKEGKAVLPPPKAESKVKQDGTSILYAMRDAGGLDQLKPWFEEKDRERLFKTGSHDWSTVSNIADAFGFANAYASPNSIFFDARAPAMFNIAGQDRLIGPISMSLKPPTGQLQENLTAMVESAEMVVRIDERIWRVPIRKVLEGVQKTTIVKPYNTSPAEIAAAPDLKMIIMTATGELSDTPRLDSILFWAAMRPP